MPFWKALASYLKRPHRIPERLIERSMNKKAQHYYAAQSEADNDLERETLLGEAARVFTDEARATAIYKRIARDRSNKIIASQTTSLDDCITMYVLVRIYKPSIMAETGVFYGAMSAMILEAMSMNGHGKLYSIDLPFPEDGLPLEERGGLVPQERRSNWELIFGDSREKLPPLLEQLKSIDAFNHDSLHTTTHMRWEYETAWSYIKSGGILSSHDVLTTPAWTNFCRRHRAEIQLSGRVYGLGIAVKASN